MYFCIMILNTKYRSPKQMRIPKPRNSKKRIYGLEERTYNFANNTKEYIKNLPKS